MKNEFFSYKCNLVKCFKFSMEKFQIYELYEVSCDEKFLVKCLACISVLYIFNINN